MIDESALRGKTCVPCRGDVPRLDRGQAGGLAAAVPGWQLNDDATHIERTFPFEEFASAQAFAQCVGDLCEEEFHHAEIAFGWGYCRVEFQTRKIRGLHENDFVMAAKANALYEA